MSGIWLPDDFVEVVVKARTNALISGAFGDAEKIARYLTECGVEMKDTNQGIRWSRVSKVPSIDGDPK